MSKILFLDNIRSSHNVGSIFRTADGAGVSKIYLVGYTPAPVDRFGREVSEIKKTSLGASKTVEWESIANDSVAEKLVQLKKEGFQVVAVEQAKDSISLHDFIPGEKTCFIMGNEIDGVNPKILEVSDEIVEIPMRGSKESLNVSVTAGIILFQK